MEHSTRDGNTNPMVITIVLLFAALLIGAVIYFIKKNGNKLDAPAYSDALKKKTLATISEYFKSYYEKIRNQMLNSYSMMYSIELDIDDELPSPLRVSDLRNIGLAYKELVDYGYPYLASIANSEDVNEWNTNLSQAHNMIDILAEMQIIQDVLDAYGDKLEPKKLNKLQDRLTELTETRTSDQAIKEMLGIVIRHD